MTSWVVGAATREEFCSRRVWWDKFLCAFLYGENLLSSGWT